MTHEDKNLLIKDLSMRLPYKPICMMGNREENYYIAPILIGGYRQLVEGSWNVTPFLFPMSMLFKEITINGETFTPIRKIVTTGWEIEDDGSANSNCGFDITPDDMFDYLSQLMSMHFDVNGLIEKGLAIAVTEKNNPYKEKRKEG